MCWYFFDSQGKEPPRGRWIKQRRDKNGKKICDEQLKQMEEFYKKEKGKKGKEGRTGSSSSKDDTGVFYEIAKFS